MSFEQQEGAFQDFTDQPEASIDDAVKGGFFSGLNPLTPLRGVASGALQSISVAAHGLPALAKAYASELPSPIQESLQTATKMGVPEIQEAEKAGEYMEEASQAARRGAKAVMPDPRTTGTAANVLFGASKVMTEVGLIAATGAETGTVAAGLGYIEGISRYRDLRDQGVDEGTARKAATIDGLMQGAGMFAPAGLPTSWIESMQPVSQFLTQLAIGAAANTGQGVVSRWATHKILDDAGYHDMAEQSKAMDGEALAADLLSGAFFGGFHYAGQRGELAQRAQEAVQKGLIDSPVRDAAKVVQDFHEATVNRAPGVPVDFQSQATHMAALEKASEDLLADRPVDVSEQVKDGATFARPQAETSQVRDILTEEFKRAGVLAEQTKLDDLWEALESRYERDVKPLSSPIEMPDAEGAVRPAEEQLEHAGTQSDLEKEAPDLLKAVSECVGRTA